MSLATRCTHCGTVFRVVQDQLKISEGWVRCGRCQEVFNAVEGLFDLDREPPPTWPQPAQAGDMAPAAASAPARDDTGVDERPLLHTDDSVLPDDFADARFPSELGPDDEDVDASVDHATRDDAHTSHDAPAPVDVRAATPANPPVDAPSPHFMRVAEQAQRWEQPRTRASLGLLALVLGVLLAGQATAHLRADVAARWPAARPVLEAWCAIAGCTVEAPLDLQSLAVDSSGLIKLETEGLYRLEIVLRNRAEHDVRAPSIDLSLTDASGRLVTRKMMSAAEFNAPRRAISAGGELPLHALLSSGKARIAGYTIDLFYP